MKSAATVSDEILTRYPAADCAELDRLLRTELEANKRKIVVLDDDPTGVQTVHGVSVYTAWDKESIRAGFGERNRLFFILTNSRGLTAEQTVSVHREIIQNIVEVSGETGVDFLVASRSDSTLRGHYPIETETLKSGIEAGGGRRVDGEILCPFFKEGGRYTIGNIHYVRYGNSLVPSGNTEFAGDKTFGYRSSDLRDYVEEKTGGRHKAASVACISLESLRNLDFDGIAAQLAAVENFNKIIINAIDYCDIKVFCTALYRALKQGKYFLFRTAAALVKELGGIGDRPLLTGSELVAGENRNGGVVVVGSHTRKTTRQLEALKELPQLKMLPFDSDLVLWGDEALQKEVDRVVRLTNEAVSRGVTTVIYTKRTPLTVENDARENALLRSVKISDAVQSLIGNMSVTPGFIIAKGGITSSDIGTKALGVKCARVLGQLRPGIPVWRLGEESKFPRVPYVIFPGNVGEEETLKEAVEILLSV